MNIKGVDVSSNNCGGTGNVDFSAVKRAGYDFAMIRVGYSTLQNNATGTGHGIYISKSGSICVRRQDSPPFKAWF